MFRRLIFFSSLVRKTSIQPIHQLSPTPSSVQCRFLVEFLETRNCPATVHPHLVVFHPQSDGSLTPFRTAGPTGTTPADIRHAYGFDKISFAGGTVAADGAGMTIAVVDAYDDPNITYDLKKFDAQFHLPDPTFTKVNQRGGSSMPKADSGWGSEIALDVEWAHAIAPKAAILLVEADSASYDDMIAAVRYAAGRPGVVAVSMSWGSREFAAQLNYDKAFTTPAGHLGVTFIASSGDYGAPPSYPATSPNVLSVGGTTLRTDTSGNILSESAWSGSGGGVSSQEPLPSWQKGLVGNKLPARLNPDVAYDSDPKTGFPVHDSFANGTANPWSQYGGTSAAAPQWAALIAIADQGRSLVGLSSLDGASETLPKIYSMPASNFNDVVSGYSNGNHVYYAGAGYDLATGRGSPRADLVVSALVGVTSAPKGAHFVFTAAASTSAGATFILTVTAVDGSNHTLTGYTGTVLVTSTDGQAGLAIRYQFKAADKGVHVFKTGVVLKTAGTQTIFVADKAKSAISSSFTVDVSPGQAARLAFDQQPSIIVAGATMPAAVTVKILDPYGNLVASDADSSVTLAATGGKGTLRGTTTATVVGGKATFSDLTVDQSGVHYRLTAGSSGLTTAVSLPFDVTAPMIGWQLVEDFEKTSYWHVKLSWSASAYRAGYAAHDGEYGLDDYWGWDWLYRDDPAPVVHAGDSISTWLKFAGSADGRAYFGFSAGQTGTFSLVAAGSSNQLILQLNSYFWFQDLAVVKFNYTADHWYRLQVDWGVGGRIVGRIFDSDGATLLQTVAANSNAYSDGTIAFRSTASDAYFDTVQLLTGAAHGHAASTPGFTAASVLAAAEGDGAPSVYLLSLLPTTDAVPVPTTASPSSGKPIPTPLAASRIDDALAFAWAGDDRGRFLRGRIAGVEQALHWNDWR